MHLIIAFIVAHRGESEGTPHEPTNLFLQKLGHKNAKSMKIGTFLDFRKTPRTPTKEYAKNLKDPPTWSSGVFTTEHL